MTSTSFTRHFSQAAARLLALACVISTGLYQTAWSQQEVGLAEANIVNLPVSANKLLDSYGDIFNQGADLYKDGDLEGALACFQKAKSIEPRDTTVRSALAAAYAKLHRFSEAETELQALISMQPEKQEYVLNLAQLYLEQGKYQNANSLYQKILSSDPKNTKALAGAAMSFEGDENLESARDCWEQVIQLSPNSTEAAQAEARLGRISNAQKAQTSRKFFPIDPDIGQAGFGWWNLRHMPLNVYIDSGDDIQGYRLDMRQLTQRALDVWTYASRGAITFNVEGYDARTESGWKKIEQAKPVMARLQESLRNMPNDPVPCDLHIHWTDLTIRTGGGGKVLGMTWTSRFKDGNPILSKAHIWIVTNRLADGSLIRSKNGTTADSILEAQDRMMTEVITHELGHALGLPHLANPNDVMCAGIFGQNAVDLSEPRQLSSRDVQSLAEHYDNFEGTGIAILANKSALLDEGTGGSGGGGTAPGGSSGGSSGGPAPPEPQTPSPPSNDAGGGPSGQGGTGGGTTGSKSANPGGDEKTDEEKSDEEKSDEEKEQEEREKAERERTSASLQGQSYSAIRDALYDISTQQYARALDKLNKILQNNPNNPQALYLRAVTHVNLRDYKLAIADYKQVVHLAPTSDLGKKAQDGLKKLNF